MKAMWRCQQNCTKWNETLVTYTEVPWDSLLFPVSRKIFFPRISVFLSSISPSMFSLSVAFLATHICRQRYLSSPSSFQLSLLCSILGLSKLGINTENPYRIKIFFSHCNCFLLSYHILILILILQLLCIHRSSSRTHLILWHLW